MQLSNETLLLTSILIPFIASIGIFIFSQTHRSLCKYIAYIGFIFPAIIALCLTYAFLGADPGDYAFLSEWHTGLEVLGIKLILGLNPISMPMFLLAGIVGLAAGLYAIQSKAKWQEIYWALLLLMLSGLMGTFASVDIFFFYFFHEFALIPTFIMIGIWGGRGSWAIALELTIYLTVGAMLSLIGLIAIYTKSGLQNFNLIELKEMILLTGGLNFTDQSWIFGLLLFGFGILVSLFPFYTWAPKAYAAAPSANTMLHAGVLKKFGLYGLIQIGSILLPIGLLQWNQLLVALALSNIVLIGFATVSQWDLKQMLGFSSVMHMGYCFLGIATFSVIGIGGAVVLMFAHGLAVSLLFLLATSVHHRTGTYVFDEMGGLAKKAPILAFMFIAATLANIGLPGFANFWGELSIFVALWNYNPWVMATALLGIIISSIYGLRAVAKIFMGSPKDPIDKIECIYSGDLNLSEKIPASILLIALLFVGFYPEIITNSLNDVLSIQMIEDTTQIALQLNPLNQ